MSASFRRVLAVAFCGVACGALVHAAGAADEKESNAGKSQFDVPDGPPKELLAFIKKMQKLPGEGTTRKERMDHLRNVNKAIVTAAERIADAKADDDTAVTAVKAELDALTMLKRLNDEDASEKLDALSEKLKNDKRPAVAQMLKLVGVQQKLEKLNQNDTEAVESFVSDAKELLTTSDPEPQLIPVAQAATVLLFRSGKRDEAAELGRKLADRFLKSENADMAVGAFQLANITGQILEAQGHEKQAAELYHDFAERFSKNDNPALRQAAEQFEGSARKLALVGQPMSISGKLVEGGQFDITQYKGKVVLVDFWATWCGPCIAELPNVKETYEKFHDRGFEVVGISLDSELEKLTKFIEEEKIPWPILFEGGEETSGWNHPLAKQYGVNAIPMAVLINKEGKVVTLSARGEKLGELVAELLGVKESDGAGSKKEKKAG
jgi:peroxiredoxin